MPIHMDILPFLGDHLYEMGFFKWEFEELEEKCGWNYVDHQLSYLETKATFALSQQNKVFQFATS